MWGVSEVSVVVVVVLVLIVLVVSVVVVFVICVLSGGTNWCGWPMRCSGLCSVGGGGGMVLAGARTGWASSRRGGVCRAMSPRIIARMSRMDLCSVSIGYCLLLDSGLCALRGGVQ